MRVELTRRASRDLDTFSPRLQSTVRKQFALLATNIRHPSLRAKKYEGRDELWQGRINRNYRFFFTIKGDTCSIITIVPHPK